MAELYIHIPGGEQLSIVPEASSSQDWALMGDNKLSLSFQQYECVILPAGSWCEFDGVIFYLLQEYKPTMIHSHLWQYNVAFVDGASWLGVTTALKTIDGEDAPLFTLTAPAAEHAAIIVSNMNRRLGSTVWKVGSVIDTPNITIEYTGKYCGAVLQEIVDDQNTEWWVDGTTLNIGRAEFGSLIELGYRDGLLGDIAVTQTDNMSSYRTLYPVGSTRNILPTEYGHDRLQLPNGQKSVMMNPAGVAELVEEAAFAGIYPRYVGTVTGVSTSIGQSADGSQYLIYNIADTAIPFNPNEYEMPGLVKHITFQSGELMGAEFEVNYNPASNEFELITQFQENGSQLPGGMLIPQVGDEYVVWNISMPAEYYPLAEQELLEAAESFAASSIRESNVYKVKLDYIDVQERGLSLRPGQKVRLHSVDYFPEQGYYDSRITRVTRPVNYPGEYTIDVSAVRVVGSLTRLQTSLAAATTKVNSLSNTVQTVVQTVSNAVTLTGNQRVKGVKDFEDGVRIGGLFASKLKDDTLYFDGNIVLRGGLTMYGKNTTTSPSIFSVLPIDGVTIGRNERGELCVIGGTSGGGGVVDYIAWSNVTNKPAWITDTKPKYSYSEILDTPDLSVYAIKSSVDNALSKKADKATTLAGYGITNAYTKSEVNNIIDSLDDTYVTIAGEEQSITAVHNFVNGFKVGGKAVEYNATKDIVYLDSNLVVRGGITMYGDNGTTLPSIFDALPIDNETIKRNANGQLYAVAGGGSGTGGLDYEMLDSYLTTNKYITSDALSAYLPKAGGRLTGNVIMTDGVTIRSSEGNVAGTLKFGADTANFRTILGTATRETLLIGTTAIKFWRGANSKEYTVLDSYNYSDYALPKDGTAVAASKLATSLSLWGRTFDGSADLTGSVTVTTGEGYRIQYNNYDLRFIISGSTANRGIWDNTNSEWLMYRNSSTNIFFPQGNVAIGSHITPSERLSVNGNINLSGAYNYKIQGKDVVSIYSTNYYLADSAIELGYNTFVVGRKINFQTSTTTTKTTTATLDGSGNFSITGVLKLPAVDSGFTNPRITFGDSVIRIGATTAGLLGVYASGDIRLNPNSASSANSTMGLWLKASGFNGINISSPTQALHVNGKGIFADATNPWVSLQRDGVNWYMQVTSGGLRLGRTSANAVGIDESGNLQTPGAITMYYSSDKRLKQNIRKVNASKTLLSLGGVYQYEYIDSEVAKNSTYGGSHYGLIYQNVKGSALDKMCFEREDGMGALNYLDTNFISLIAGATMENISEVEKLKRKIRTLETKVKQLESRA